MEDFSFMKRLPYFGEHPGLRWNVRHRLKRIPIRNVKERCAAMHGMETSVNNFFDPRHPSVYLIPRDRPHRLIDNFGDYVGPEEIQMMFSSTNFYANREDDWVFQEIENPLFWRQAGISELGYLMPPYKEKHPELSIDVIAPPYPHVRWTHCFLAAAMAEVILSESGFSPKERAPIVLTILYHDSAMPAGGDSVKRIDPGALNEEDNFAFVLQRHGLDGKWRRKFDFDLDQAIRWVHNQDCFGRLLDVLDKISYVAWDCYQHGAIFDGLVRRHCLGHPLFIDVWRDIRFSPDRQQFAFTNPNSVYIFLLARAYEHQELLFNPVARVLDFYLAKLVKPLYQQGIITKENLLDWNTQQLETVLERHYHGKEFRSVFISTDNYQWRKFSSQKELDRFAAGLGDALMHTEYITGFNPGLDFPVYKDAYSSTIVPLADVLPQEKIVPLQEIVKSVKGYYAYWRIDNDS